MEGQFHFLALWHITNSKEAYGITWPYGPHHFRLGVLRIFSDLIWKRLEWHKIKSFHEHGTIDHLGLIHFSYTWLCNQEHPFLVWSKGKSPGALHAGQALLRRVAPIRCGTMWFLCAPAVQLVDQPCTTFSFVVGSEVHHQRPQPSGFSHIAWSKLLPTSYKARETFLVSCEHNRKTMKCLAHLCFLPRSTHLSERWIKLGVLSCFSHLGWTKPIRKRKGYGVPNWYY
jgi:hypothetical protein